MDGLDYNTIALSEEEIPTPLRGQTPMNDPVEEEPPQPSLKTMHGQPPPRGTGDDLFGIANLTNDPVDNKLVQLEGIPSDKFEGDRAKTHKFLTQFK